MLGLASWRIFGTREIVLKPAIEMQYPAGSNGKHREEKQRQPDRARAGI